MSLPIFATKYATRRGTPKKRGHVALFSFFQSPHPEAFFLLGRKIAAANRNVQVTVFTPNFYGMYLYWYWNPDEDHNLQFFAVGDWDWEATPFDCWNERLREYLEDIGENMRCSISRAEEGVGEKITYVVADAFLADVCRGIAEERGIRWSAVWTSSAASLAAYMHGDQIRLKSGLSLPQMPVTGPLIIPNVVPDVVNPIDILNRSSAVVGIYQPVDKFLPGFPAGVPLLRLPQGSITDPKDFEFFPFAKMFHDMVRSLPKAEAIVVDSFPGLESSVANGLLGPNFHLGGLFSLTLPIPPVVDELLEDPEGIFPWLDAAPAGSVVYINLLGSTDLEAPPESEFHALAEALEATGVRFLWYIANTWPRVKLPEGFEERTSKTGQGKVVRLSVGPVRLMKRERDVLRHAAVGAQMRPSAWWQVAESVAAGKPIICKPANFHVYNQALNMSLVERVWGIGVELEGWALTRITAEKALRRGMLEEEGRRMKEKASALRKLAEEDAHGSSAQTLDKFITLILTK